VTIRLQGIEDEGLINKGDVLCTRENLVPISELFECEIDLTSLLDHKPIVTKGFSCVMHLHTGAFEVEINDIVSVTEVDSAGH